MFPFATSIIELFKDDWIMVVRLRDETIRPATDEHSSSTGASVMATRCRQSVSLARALYTLKRLLFFLAPSSITSTHSPSGSGFRLAFMYCGFVFFKLPSLGHQIIFCFFLSLEMSHQNCLRSKCKDKR